MKFRKISSIVAASAMCASVLSTFATSASAIAQGNAIDFEDGDSSFVYLNIYDGGTDATVSVADFNGSKQLKIDPVDYTKSPKVWFDLDKIMERATATEIYTIELDITFAPVDPAGQLGWIGGGFGAAGGFDKDNIQASQAKPNWSADNWELTDGNNYVEGGISTVHATKKFLLPSSKYSVDGTNPFFCIMAWEGITADYDMYIDNIVFKNKAGDTLSVGVTAAAETEAAPAETDAPADTTAAVAETTAATEAAPAETQAAAPSADLSALEGTVVSAEGGSSDGAWGQAVVLQTIKNEGGVFDASLIAADKAIVAYYEADTAPELILQSWSGGAGWAKVPASALSTDGVAVFTYEDMAAMYEAENFVDTLDAVNIGDTGSALKVTKVMVVDAASLSAAPAETTAVAATTAAPDAAATTPVKTGNVPAAAMAVVMVASAAAAVIAKRK